MDLLDNNFQNTLKTKIRTSTYHHDGNQHCCTLSKILNAALSPSLAKSVFVLVEDMRSHSHVTSFAFLSFCNFLSWSIRSLTLQRVLPGWDLSAMSMSYRWGTGDRSEVGLEQINLISSCKACKVVNIDWANSTFLSLLILLDNQ